MKFASMIVLLLRKEKRVEMGGVETGEDINKL